MQASRGWLVNGESLFSQRELDSWLLPGSSVFKVTFIPVHWKQEEGREAGLRKGKINRKGETKAREAEKHQEKEGQRNGDG